MKTIGRLIGNAVPVTLGELIGRSMKAHVKAHREDVLRMLAEGQLA